MDACELQCFPGETTRVFENAIERLFYADSFRVGNATLPQSRVRARLKLLDYTILQSAEAKLHANLDRPVRNSTAYTSSPQAAYPSLPPIGKSSLISLRLLSPYEPLRWVYMGAPEGGR